MAAKSNIADASIPSLFLTWNHDPQDISQALKKYPRDILFCAQIPFNKAKDVATEILTLTEQNVKDFDFEKRFAIIDNNRLDQSADRVVDLWVMYNPKWNIKGNPNSFCADFTANPSEQSFTRLIFTLPRDLPQVGKNLQELGLMKPGAFPCQNIYVVPFADVDSESAIDAFFEKRTAKQITGSKHQQPIFIRTGWLFQCWMERVQQTSLRLAPRIKFTPEGDLRV